MPRITLKTKYIIMKFHITNGNPFPIRFKLVWWSAHAFKKLIKLDTFRDIQNWTGHESNPELT